MASFTYTITDEHGIHARPAGELIKKLQEFSATVTIAKGEKKADGKKLFAVMALGVKKGDEITVTIEGENEDKVCAMAKEFLENNL